MSEESAARSATGKQRRNRKEAPEAAASRPKTAVVLIHGIGEQRPMETLWGFVDTIWSKDRDLVETYDAPTYAKPDFISQNIDLRRVTTRYWKGEDPRRVDFFEYYWAHLMRGNTVRSTVDWILSLFIRSPSTVPSGLRRVWFVGLLFVLLAIALFVAAALPQALAQLIFERNVIVALAVLSTLGGIIAVRWLAPIAGDAARYFSTRPDNVDARHSISTVACRSFRRSLAPATMTESSCRAQPRAAMHRILRTLRRREGGGMGCRTSAAGTRRGLPASKRLPPRSPTAPLSDALTQFRRRSGLCGRASPGLGRRARAMADLRFHNARAPLGKRTF